MPALHLEKLLLQLHLNNTHAGSCPQIPFRALVWQMVPTLLFEGYTLLTLSSRRPHPHNWWKQTGNKTFSRNSHLPPCLAALNLRSLKL